MASNESEHRAKQNLEAKQIKAAERLHGRLLDWQFVDECLRKVRQTFPDNDDTSTLIKATAVNGLYRTYVLSIHLVALARYVAYVLRTESAYLNGNPRPEIVELMANLPTPTEQNERRRYRSFASKYAHFFISEEHFPIYDSFAVRRARYHLPQQGNRGQNGNSAAIGGPTYVTFVDDVNNVKGRVDWPFPNDPLTYRQLDRYLWLSGQYERWLKAPKEKKVKMELDSFFRDPSNGPDLREMMG